MYPKLEVYLDGNDTPVIVQPLTVDFEIAEELYGSKKVTDAGLRLVVAYCQVEGTEPKTLAQVREWGRTRQVQIGIGTAPDPTQAAAIAD